MEMFIINCLFGITGFVMWPLRMLQIVWKEFGNNIIKWMFALITLIVLGLPGWLIFPYWILTLWPFHAFRPIPLKEWVVALVVYTIGYLIHGKIRSMNQYFPSSLGKS
jgi:hypothetical protein